MVASDISLRIHLYARRPIGLLLTV